MTASTEYEMTTEWSQMKFAKPVPLVPRSQVQVGDYVQSSHGYSGLVVEALAIGTDTMKLTLELHRRGSGVLRSEHYPKDTTIPVLDFGHGRIPTATEEADRRTGKLRGCYNDAQLAVIERVERELITGRSLSLAAQGHKSRPYGSVLHRQNWCELVDAMATMASKSDALAQLAVAVIGKANLYEDRRGLCANAYDAALSAWGRGYDDVVGRSGPEGSRYDVKPYGIGDALILAHWLAWGTRSSQDSVPGVGWCVAALVERHNIPASALAPWPTTK